MGLPISTWGAIALPVDDETKTGYGTSDNLKTKRQAKNAAIADCEAKTGKKCKHWTYFEYCAALAVNDVGTGTWFFDAVFEYHAREYGEGSCTEKTGHKCHTVWVKCNEPRQRSFWDF